jgi:hypothetical protein
VIAADASLPASEAAAAVDAVATSPAVLRELASRWPPILACCGTGRLRWPGGWPPS